MTRSNAPGRTSARRDAPAEPPVAEKTIEIGGRPAAVAAALLAVVVLGGAVLWFVRSGAVVRMQAQFAQWPIPTPDPAPFAQMEPDVQVAITDARAAVESNRGSAEAWRHLGMVYDAHSLWELARLAYERALSLAPADERTAYYAATAADMAGAPTEEVVAAYERSIKLSPTYAPAHLRLGDALLRVGRTVEARDALQRAVDTYPPDASARARRSLGLALIALGDAEGAAASLLASVRIRADDAATWKALAQVYNQLGRGQEARQAIDRSASLGETLGYFDDWRLAVLELNASRSLVEKRIIEKAQMGMPDEALADALRWEAVHPDWPSIKRLIGNLHRTAGRDDLARPYFEAATDLVRQGKTE